MPTEAAPLAAPSGGGSSTGVGGGGGGADSRVVRPTSSASPSSSSRVLAPPNIKCSHCWAFPLGRQDGIVIVGPAEVAIERVCARCVRAHKEDASPPSLGTLGLRLTDNNYRWVPSLNPAVDCAALPVSVMDLASLAPAPAALASDGAVTTSPTTQLSPLPDVEDDLGPLPPTSPLGIPTRQVSSLSISTSPSPPLHSKSLPAASAAPWTSFRAVKEKSKEMPASAVPEQEECAPNPLLDVTRLRVRSSTYGCLYPGSKFHGTQSSGRSEYEVDVTIVDVHLAESTVCGYLSISHLTETHPQLTTYWEGEIIGPRFGFVTGTRFGATMHDDMRHWGRFEQFRLASTRAAVVRPDTEMLLRDPIPDASKGETRARERDFVFLRIKEKFLVPDHHVRDISGASFAGFYYAMIDLSPTVEIDDSIPTSPLVPKSPLMGTRRQSSSGPRPDPPQRRTSSANGTDALAEGSPRRPSATGTRPAGVRRQSSSRPAPPQKVATLSGYYFHSLNQEPFQQLSLQHVPETRRGKFELR
ncbi:hypothetical protein Q8F55_001655 [Vanrija albida]|uniref:Vacuolar import and degradation protein-domain-containing protein n=1 Tax=Vanrija albida TaxID=181172 RepID=A0ABR3Q7R8_9TREE